MNSHLAWVLVFLGAALIGTGCARPLDVATTTANVAAASLSATHAAVTAHRFSAQEEAAKRVKGDRSDPSVRAEQIDRAAEVGRSYIPIWQAYTVARETWATAVAIIDVARKSEGGGGVNHVTLIMETLAALARAQAALAQLAEQKLPDGIPVEATP